MLHRAAYSEQYPLGASQIIIMGCPVSGRQLIDELSISGAPGRLLSCRIDHIMVAPRTSARTATPTTHAAVRPFGYATPPVL
jgi:hypothetical protein